MESNNKSKSLLDSFKYAMQGIKTAIKAERNMKVHVLLMLIVIIAGIVLKISSFEWIVCVILFGLVISAELINTSLEAIVDIIMPDLHPKAKVAKDIAASSVLVIAVVSAIVGMIIFIPKIVELVK